MITRTSRCADLVHFDDTLEGQRGRIHLQSHCFSISGVIVSLVMMVLLGSN